MLEINFGHMLWFGIILEKDISVIAMMETKKKNTGQNEDKDWENPTDPEQPADERDNEQLKRQKEEAERRKENLTETDHIDHTDKPDKN